MPPSKKDDEKKPNPYSVLDLAETCTQKEVKDAYRKYCLKWHPDKHQEDKEEAERRFIAGREAFDLLFDEEKRAEFDAVKRRREAAQKARDALFASSDAARKSMAEKLERQEREAEERAERETMAARHRTSRKAAKADLERIRQQLEEEAAAELRSKIAARHLAAAKPSTAFNSDEPSTDDEKRNGKLQIRWPVEQNLDVNEVRSIFGNYGTILELLGPMDGKKGKTCVLEIRADDDLQHTLGADNETAAGRLKAKWIERPTGVNRPAKTANGAELGRRRVDDHITTLSFDDLETQLFGGGGGGIPSAASPKRPRWQEDEEEERNRV